jgi:precorrin isomerase
LKRKKLAIFDRLRVNSNFELEKEPLLEGLKLHADDINEVYIGIDTKLIKTDLEKLENEIKSVLKGEEKEKLKEQKNSQNNTRISNNKDNSKNEEEEKVVVVKDLYEIKKMILSDSFKFYKEGKSQTN